MADKKTKQENVHENKGVQLAIISSVAIIIVLLVVIIVILLSKRNENSEQEETRRNIVVNKENVESVANQLVEDVREYVEPGYFTCSMDTEWHFPSGDSVSTDARVDNLAENTNDVYFDVFLASDESEPIYRSPVIPVGSYLENIALDKILDEGIYDCVIVYHLIDKNQNTISTLRVAFMIVVES